MVKPIVKWVGGKTQLIKHLKHFIPDHFSTYYEIFAGSLAMLVYLYNNAKIKNAVISDTNKELINFYYVTKYFPDELIEEIHKIDKTPTKDAFLKNREKFNAIKGKSEYFIERASLFLYLNKFSYNGLYRENKEGKYNVSFGRYKEYKIPTDDMILDFSKMLQNVKIMNADFEIALKNVVSNDFVYLDPPYFSYKNNFTSYTSNRFTKDDHIRIAKILKILNKNNVRFILTNADTDFTRKLFSDFYIIPIKTNRMINSNVKERKNMGKEIIVTNKKIFI